ncbi:MAG: homoserine kinase [Methylocystaceae bacterium]
MEHSDQPVKVVVPASTANLGAGFDTLGMALPLFMTVELGWAGGGNNYPTSNTGLIGSIIKQVMQEAEIDSPWYCQVDSQIPVARGLGSSAAAVIGALLAVNELLDRKMDQQQILTRAAALEGHADNVVPALVGGFTTAMLTPAGVYYQRFTPPDDLTLLLAVPDQKLATSGSRKVLPASVTLTDAVYNLQRACYLVGAMAGGNYLGIKEAFHDCWHQPYRSNLVLGFQELNNILTTRQDVLGVTLSGSGPSLLVLAVANPTEVHKIMERTLAEIGWQGSIYTWLPCSQGAQIERRSN